MRRNSKSVVGMAVLLALIGATALGYFICRAWMPASPEASAPSADMPAKPVRANLKHPLHRQAVGGSIPAEVVGNPVIFLGKVVRLEEKPLYVSESRYFHVAVVEVDERLKGPVDLKEVRVAFDPPQFTMESRGCFFLDPSDGHYWGHCIDPSQPNYDADLASTRHCLDMYLNPEKGLKSKNRVDRLVTAAMLIWDYRSFTYEPIGEEPIDATLSRLILETLLETDLGQPRDFLQGGVPYDHLFERLGMNEMDGWKPVSPDPDFMPPPPWIIELKDGVEVRRPNIPVPPGPRLAEARAWLERHRDSYRIKRFVEPKVANEN